jgi:beta-glucanase (GH16 family)
MFQRFRRQRRRSLGRFVPALLVLEDRLVLSPPGSGWQLQWSDEFTGTSLDTSKWTVHTGSRRDAVNTADAISVGGGHLTITTYTSGGTNYTGFLGTKEHFQATYGYWEARINFQDSPGEWSAFWDQSPTMGNPLGNPAVAGTEIDTVEHRVTDGSRDISNQAQSTIHWDGYGANHQSVTSGLRNNPGGTSLQGNFHLYALQWSPSAYQFYIDGIQIWSTSRAVSQRSEYIFLTSEVQNHSWAGNIPSGGYGSLTTSHTKMMVSYVRVYEQLPSAWASIDIGNPGILGSASFLPGTGTWTVAGSGADIWGTSDQFHLAAETWVGDGRVVAQVNSIIQNTNAWAKAEVMVRASADPDAPFADVLATPSQGVSFQWRSTAGEMANSVTVPGVTAPVWVQLLRSGDAFSGSYSTDGVTWTQIGDTQTVPMNPTALAGLAVTSHNINATTSAAFSHVSVLPGSWTDADIGVPGLPGSSVFDPASGAWTIAGSGADIWGTSDQFHFASQGFTGDGSLTAQVTSVQNTNPWAKAGVMFRDSSDASAAFADVVVTPGNGVAFQWRTTAGGPPTNVNVTGLSAPLWVQLARSGNDFSAYYSTDGVQWTQLGATQTIAMNSTTLAGLAVTAHNNGTLSTATFTHVSLLPAGWGDTDIGGPGQPGFANYDTASNTWTVAGGGADIWGTADQFHFASQYVTGDASLTGQVTGVQNTNAWAKAGVMFRDGTDPGAPVADVLATPGQGVSFQWRSAAGAAANSVTVPGVTTPVWVQLVRAGDDFSGFYSTDGITWTQIGTTQTIVMNPTALAGLAVTAHNNAALNIATFTDVLLVPGGGGAPGIGVYGRGGSADDHTASDTWTGAAIGKTSDQTRVASEDFTGNGRLAGQVPEVQSMNEATDEYWRLFPVLADANREQVALATLAGSGAQLTTETERASRTIKTWLQLIRQTWEQELQE